MAQTGNDGVYLGVELGSTRIKAALVDGECKAVAGGAFSWENKLVDGMWSYDLDEAWKGTIASLRDLGASNVLPQCRAIGISAMMHGYLAFDENDELLVPFRTWRNTVTERASAELTELFEYPIPQRWSAAHLYQAILNGEEHVGRVRFITTLAGYVHWKLTGHKVLGVGDASGMFPIDPATKKFDRRMIELFDKRTTENGFARSLGELLPEPLSAGESAGTLTEAGKKLLGGDLAPAVGTPLAPPEGDAGSGMIATNSIRERTGNVSAGTSVFGMIVLEKELPELHTEIDLVTTPDGKPVAMAHANNCSSEVDTWVKLFGEAASRLGVSVGADELYATLLGSALEADADAGGIISYGYLSGEHITEVAEGRPLLARLPDANVTLANLMRAHLYGALCALRMGIDILVADGVTIEQIQGHGGFFKTENVGLRMMAAALNLPVRTLEGAGEGGAWGMAVLARYLEPAAEGTSLPDYLDSLFEGKMGVPVAPVPKEVVGFNRYFEHYKAALPLERQAAKLFRRER
jgi:sugar (pentulose or hexulose) kinase